MALWDGVGANSRVDGDVRYRVDKHGRHIGILPATCKRGLHSLAETGYSHTDNDEENLLRIIFRSAWANPIRITPGG